MLKPVQVKKSTVIVMVVRLMKISSLRRKVKLVRRFKLRKRMRLGRRGRLGRRVKLVVWRRKNSHNFNRKWLNLKRKDPLTRQKWLWVEPPKKKRRMGQMMNWRMTEGEFYFHGMTTFMNNQ